MHLQIESKFGKQLIIAKEEGGQRDYVHFVIMKNWTGENKIPSNKVHGPYLGRRNIPDHGLFQFK